jgi:hypothetical protein
VNISQSGEYDIAAGDANTPTTVSVLAGSASIGQLQVPAGQAGYLTGTGQTTAQLGPLQHDAFMDHVLAELAPPPPPYAPPVVAQMTGVNELSSYGAWDQSPQYGAIWYPSVAVGWAPYREGHWAYVAPWGWTWVDAAPWGFAPFHYGRWIQDGGRWGWVPAGYAGGVYGPDYQPVYAPAVVGFLGLGVGVAITAAILSSGSIGWVPLAPGEAYYPGYHADPDYMRRINRVDVRDYRQINVHDSMDFNTYANRHAATYIPGAAMARGESVARYGHAVPEGMFGQVRPVQGNVSQALRPDFAPHEAAAPHPTDFAQHRNTPQPVVSHQPFEPGARPQSGEIHANLPGSNGGVIRPGETYHPPAQPGGHPPVPAQQFHPQAPAQQFHAPTPHVDEPHVYESHAPAQPVDRPAERQPVPGQQFHPQAQQQFHPQMQQFHPQEQQQFHPQAQQSHPQAAPHPQAARPDDRNGDHHP